MKVVLLHGPAIVSSRLKLKSLQQNFSENEIFTFDITSSIQDILGSLTTMPLLSQKKLVILENAPDDWYDKALSRLDKTLELTLILWFNEEIGDKKPFLPWVKSLTGEICFFPEVKEASIFPLLDLLGERDKRAFLELNKLQRNDFDTQYMITMILYLLRNLVSINRKSPKFVQQKLFRQQQHFTLSEITDLYQSVLEIDFKLKKGLMEQDQAQFLLINRFVDLS